MFYLLTVGVSESPDDAQYDGMAISGTCTSYFDATQEVYKALHHSMLKGYFIGSLWVLRELPTGIPLGTVAEPSAALEEVFYSHADEELTVEACKLDGQPSIDLMVENEVVPPAIIMIPVKVLRRLKEGQGLQAR